MLLENSSITNMVEAMDPRTFKIDLTFEQTQYSNQTYVVDKKK
jgi:hypothetical protein